MEYNFYYQGNIFNSEKKIEIINPNNNNVIFSAPSMNKEHIDEIYNKAEDYFRSFSRISPEEKIVKLEKFNDLVIKNKEMIAETIMLEVAKGYNSALSEVERTVEYVQETIVQYKKMLLDTLEYSKFKNNRAAPKKDAWFYRVSHGVSLCISPFNYPFNLAMSKIAPALITGNTVVFKPATQGTLTGSLIVHFLLEAGFDHGAIQIIVGRGSEIGDYSVDHEKVKSINFTGGTEVGKRIQNQRCALPLVLELGGNDPGMIVDDYNMEKYVSEIIKGAFSYSGQRCTAIKRVYVLKELHQKFIKELMLQSSKITFGDPKDNMMVSSVINKKVFNYVKQLTKEAIDNGANVLLGNKFDEEKNIIQPTILDNCKPDDRIILEEQFAPVLPICIVDSVREMITKANQGVFGLQSSLFIKPDNNELIDEFMNSMDVGSLNVNASSARGPDIFPYIGVKDSGFGVQGIIDSLLFFTRYKGLVKQDI